MKILWFTNTPCGATERLLGTKVTGGGWLYALAEELKKRSDIDLHIAFYWGSDVKSFVDGGITYHPVHKEGEGKSYTRALNRFKMMYGKDNQEIQIQRLMAVVNEVRPDIIHIHGSEENYGLIAEHIDSTKIVLSIQGLMSPLHEKYYSGISKYQSLKGDSIIKWIKCRNTKQEERLFHIKSLTEKKIFGHINNIIGRTFWDKRCSLALNPLRTYYEVGEILRSDFYQSSWEGSYHDKCIIVTTISNGLYKGLESVYKSASVLKNADFSFEWNVIGIGESDSYNRLVSKVCSLKHTDININLLGRKNASEMVKIMKDADMYVQVSHIENSPNSLCEAMVLGMPIIATYAGGTESLLSNNIDGWLIQDGDPYVMAGSIMDLYSNKELAEKFASNAKEKSRKRHDRVFIVNQLLSVYKTILN